MKPVSVNRRAVVNKKPRARVKMAVVVKSTKTDAVVPDGVYQAVLTKVKTFSNSFGERIGFEFQITSGKSKGATLQRSTGLAMGSRKGKLYEVLSGLLGRDLSDQELTDGIDLEELVGTVCSILVVKSANQQGQAYSNIERVFQPEAD